MEATSLPIWQMDNFCQILTRIPSKTLYDIRRWNLVWEGLTPEEISMSLTVDYRSNLYLYYTPGPLDENGTTNVFNCSNWDRHFRVTGAQIAAFRAALPLSPVELTTQFRDIAGCELWATRFLQTFGVMIFLSQHKGLRLSTDEDNNGSDDPLSGDYPVVELRGIPAFVPAEIIWSVFNDQNGGGPHSASGGKALQAEIQLTVWAFNCQI